MICSKFYKVPSGPTVAFDVDDTLLMWDLPEGVKPDDERIVTVKCRGFSERLIPNHHNVDLLKKMASRGHAIIVWSAGGSDWAEAAVKALKIEKYVSVVSGKLTYYIDDISDPSRVIGKHGYFDFFGNRDDEMYPAKEE